MKPPGRYELKYWASEAELRAVLSDLAGLLERDPHTGPDASYLVTSLYFDTANRAAFLDKLEGLRDRAKVRLRRYGSALNGFAELKQKRGRRIRKWRAPLAAEALARVARGDGAPLSCNDDEAAARFRQAFAEAPLEPVVITRYTREAWRLVDDPSVRITIDRHLCGWGQDLAATFLADDVADRGLEPLPVAAPAVLEVKVSGPVPRVIADALRGAGLQRRSISKYCLALAHTDRLPPELSRLGATFLQDST